jgi:hypothetical protein
MTAETIQPPEEPLWHQLATNPEVIEHEQRMAELITLTTETSASRNTVENYWWNSGTPYILMTGIARIARAADGKSSYANDHPQGYEQASPTASNPQPMPPEAAEVRYKNDIRVDFTTVTPIKNLGVGIGHGTDGNQYLVHYNGKVISAGYSQITYGGDRSFTVPAAAGLPAEYNGKLHILNDEGREHAHMDRARHEALERVHRNNQPARRALQADGANIALHHYGVRPEVIEQTQIPGQRPNDDTVILTFPHGKKQIEIRIKRNDISITTWSAHLTPDYYLESGGKTDKNYLFLEIVSSHATQAVPIAMHLINLPRQQQQAILGKPALPETNNLEEGELPRYYHIVTVERPGVFIVHNNGNHTFHIDSNGLPVGAEWFENPQPSPALRQAIEAVEASTTIATSVFGTILTSEGMGDAELADPLVREQLQLPPLEYTGNRAGATASIGEVLDRVAQAMATVHIAGQLAVDGVSHLDTALGHLQTAFDGANNMPGIAPAELPALQTLTNAAARLADVIRHLREGVERLQEYREEISSEE